jgi:hypothetical protein
MPGHLSPIRYTLYRFVFQAALSHDMIPLLQGIGRENRGEGRGKREEVEKGGRGKGRRRGKKEEGKGEEGEKGGGGGRIGGREGEKGGGKGRRGKREEGEREEGGGRIGGGKGGGKGGGGYYFSGTKRELGYFDISLSYSYPQSIREKKTCLKLTSRPPDHTTHPNGSHRGHSPVGPEAGSFSGPE